MQAIPIADLSDPRLAPYRNQRDAWLRAAHNPHRIDSGDGDHGLFLAEGSLVIAALLRSRCRVESVLATPARLAAIEQDLLAHAPATPVFVAPPAVMESIVGFDLHRGLLAAGRRPEPTPARALIARTRVLILAEDLSNHDNIGGVFRTVAALVGPNAGILLSPRCCDPLYRKALRVSMGHALHIPYATLNPWPAGLAEVVDAGFRILALSPAGATSIRRLDIGPGDRVAVLVGAEGPGLAASTWEALGPAAEKVAIPMAPGVDSLNVVVALAIALDRVVESIGASDLQG